ncbi:MAG TPA: DDE transposase family protein [Bacteroidales bacterium]|jgi:transposase|nr:DDE transposase family protein [Bacteroidales bacterium]
MAQPKQTKAERIRKKELAQFFFCNSNLSQKEIAEKVGISEVSMSRWVREGRWDTLKASITITRQEQLNRVYRQIAAINKKIVEEQEGIPTSADADVLAKLAAVVERLEKETSITDVVSVSMKFLDWLRKIDTEKAKELSYLFDAFIKDLLRS